MSNNGNPRFLMVDRVIKYNNQYLIYIFGSNDMNKEQKTRKNSEYLCIKKLFKQANVIAVNHNSLNDSFEIYDNHGTHSYSFRDYQQRFNKENGSQLKTSSKVLGIRKESNDDKFVTQFLTRLTGFNFIGDDEGVEITERLLEKNNTNGFDLDIIDTQNRVVYEFLRRKNQYINNLKAHPMRYCWNHRAFDNRQKFIALWNFCQSFDFRLVCVSYSTKDQPDTDIVKLIIPEKINSQVGFIKDTEYGLTKSQLYKFIKSSKPTAFLKENNIPSITLKKDDFKGENAPYKHKLQTWADTIHI